MAKEYGHVYHHAGGGCQVGKMACAVCRENIDSDTEDWLETKKEIDYDWGYISRHRVCVKDKSGWLRIEKENARHEKEVDILVATLSKYKDETGDYSSVFYDALSKLDIDV